MLLSFWSGKRWVSPHSQSIFYLSIPVHSVKLAQPPVFGASSLSCFEKQIIKCKAQLGQAALDPPVVPAWWGVAPNNSQRETSPKTLNQNCTVVHALMLCNKSNPLALHSIVLIYGRSSFGQQGNYPCCCYRWTCSSKGSPRLKSGFVEMIFDYFEDLNNFWQFVNSGHFYSLKILTLFDNFLQFWQLWTILTIQTINVFWQFW